MNSGICTLIITRLVSLDSGDGHVQPAPKNVGYDDSDNDSDEGAELLAAAQEGLGADKVMSILSKNPGLIRLADPVGDNVLHMSARDGDIVTVRKLIAFLEERQDSELKEVLVDVNVNGDTALHLALKNGYRELAYQLMKTEKETSDISNKAWRTTFKLARKAGYSEVCQLMSNKYDPVVPKAGHADVEMLTIKRDLMGASRSVAFHWNDLYTAIMDGEEEVLIRGLMNDGDKMVRQQNPRRKTLLHAAVTAPGMGPFRQLVQFMISNGLTDAFLLQDKDGNTALHWAAQTRDLSKALCLIKAAPRTVYQVNHNGVSPLYMAVNAGHEDLVKDMVSQSWLHACASEILLHPKNATLAHLAIKTRSFGTLKVLTEHLPELIKATNEKGWRPLSYAANKGYIDEVNYLLTKFPRSAKKCDKDGSFPIHKAVGGGHVSIIQAFYKECPQTLQHVDKKGRSVLHIAVCYVRADILAYLTKEIKMDDSIMNLRDNQGKTFKGYAKELQH